CAAPVTAMGAVTWVAKMFGHQFVPKVADVEDREAMGPVGKRISGKARHDDIKSVGRITSMATRIDKQRNEFCETDNGIRETVRQNDWAGIGAAPPFMDEMNAESFLQLDTELLEPIECSFLQTPIEACPPICRELPHVRDAQAELPA